MLSMLSVDFEELGPSRRLAAVGCGCPVKRGQEPALTKRRIPSRREGETSQTGNPAASRFAVENSSLALLAVKPRDGPLSDAASLNWLYFLSFNVIYEPSSCLFELLLLLIPLRSHFRPISSTIASVFHYYSTVPRRLSILYTFI